MSSSGILPCSSMLLLLVTLLTLSAPPPCHGADGQQLTHNITDILLAANPSFTDFSSALASANLTAKIDGRTTITVLAVDNAAVAQLKGRRLAPASLARVLSLHVLLDYFDDARLRRLNGSGTFDLATTLYQASGAAPGSAGLVNVSAAGGSDGRVAFLPSGAADPVFYQKSVKESRYDISVLQVSGVFSSPAAEGKAAPATPPPQAEPSPAPVAPSPAPVAAAPAPVAKPAPAPAPAPAREAPAPSPKGNTTAPPAAPAEAPEPPADEPSADEPPADQQKNAASGTDEWSLGAPVAAVVLAVVFLMW